jgi:hypothetical protein
VWAQNDVTDVAGRRGRDAAMLDLCKAHWPAIRRYALDHGTRGVAVADRVNAEWPGGWPPPVPLLHGGQGYAVGKCRSFAVHPTLQADLDRNPRASW